jgi:hypothetical protein
MRVRTRYVEIMFLHLVGSAGHVVRYCASRAQNVDALFFMLVWDREGFDKKHIGTRCAEFVFLHSLGSTCHVQHSDASGV